MWYFSWILGIGVALGFGIINVMWLEASGTFSRDAVPNDPAASPVVASGDKHL
ncbi:cyd operon protein YbgT [Paraburkholderia sp. GAS38]|jgi:cyd operon protein YbgT|uniref:cytochrome bd-I oxidase subunit CydX n=1 Tax=Paraburkholderia sp. GAS38 TaxID=3035133 RepID=UPI003D1DF2ED